MSAWGESVSALCVFGVMLGAVFLLLPQDGAGDYVRVGGRVLLAGLAMQMFLSLPVPDWSALSQSGMDQTVDAEHYVSERMAESIRASVEEEVKRTLGQFGINHGQIRIEFDKGEYGALSLAHISVGVPAEWSGGRLAIKRLLLSRFDVYCDVYLLEAHENEN